MPMLTLSAADIARLLPMADAIEVAADAFRAISRREGLYPARIHMPLEHADALVMPGYDGAAHLGVKIATVHTKNVTVGKPGTRLGELPENARTGPLEITVLKTVGHAALDLFTAAELLHRATQRPPG